MVTLLMNSVVDEIKMTVTIFGTNGLEIHWEKNGMEKWMGKRK